MKSKEAKIGPCGTQRFVTFQSENVLWLELFFISILLNLFLTYDLIHS